MIPQVSELPVSPAAHTHPLSRSQKCFALERGKKKKKEKHTTPKPDYLFWNSFKGRIWMPKEAHCVLTINLPIKNKTTNHGKIKSVPPKMLIVKIRQD